MAKSTKGTGMVATMQDEEDPEFQIAPMIDVLLVLLIFFMSITTTDVLQKSREIVLPFATKAEDKKKGVEIGEAIINVEFNDETKILKVTVDQTEYPYPGALTPELEARKKDFERSRPGSRFRVVVRADEKVLYRDLKAVMGACAAAEIQNITYSVRRVSSYDQAVDPPTGG